MFEPWVGRVARGDSWTTRGLAALVLIAVTTVKAPAQEDRPMPRPVEREAFDSRRDEVVVRRIVHVLAWQADRHGSAALPEEHRAVLLPWNAFGVVANGGFRFFYESGYDPHQVAAGCRRLGMKEAAAAFEESVRVFPDEAWIPDREERIRFVDANAPRLLARWAPLERVVWDANDDLASTAATFIRARSASFEDLEMALPVDSAWLVVDGRFRARGALTLTELEKTIYWGWVYLCCCQDGRDLDSLRASSSEFDEIAATLDRIGLPEDAGRVREAAAGRPAPAPEVEGADPFDLNAAEDRVARAVVEYLDRD